MAFPDVTTLIDDFNRSDSGVDVGAGAAIWGSASMTGGGLLVTASNALSGGGGAQCVTKASFGPEVDFVVDVKARGSGSGCYLALFWHTHTADGLPYPAFGGAHHFQSYGLTIDLSSASAWELRKYDGPASVMAAATRSFGAGDQIGVSQRANVITVLHKPSGGSWSTVMSATDGGVLGVPAYVVGNVGFELGGNAPLFALDALRGGTYVAVPPASEAGVWAGGYLVDPATGALLTTQSFAGAKMSGGLLRDPEGRVVVIVRA